MWTEFSLARDAINLAEPEILWTMRGEFSDELIYGMVIAAYTAFVGHRENGIPLEGIYSFQGDNMDEGYIYDIAGRAYDTNSVFGADEDHIELNYYVKVKTDVPQLLYHILQFDTPEWLQGFISMCNAMQVDYRNYFISDIIETETKQHYHIQL